MNIIVKMQFGSHLYGTATSESDRDYKGVFLPSKEQIFLGKIPKSYSYTTKQAKGKGTRNTPDDMDTEIYSLHYFIELACQGQTVALDMLHASESCILEQSPIWKKIVQERYRFYTSSLKAFVGYARTQAAKYGIKGSRLDAVERVVEFLRAIPCDWALQVVWHRLPKGEHIHFLDRQKDGLLHYQVCGKQFQETAKVCYVLPVLEKFLAEYGKRAKMAQENQGIDWKALSHALRAAYQVKNSPQITLPLHPSGLPV